MLTNPRSVLGVVLAGGQSRRMGHDKALLPYRGQRLLDHQVQLLQTVCTQVVVSGSYSGYECITDLHQDCGPLAGLAAVAAVYPDHALLCVPVDMPLLSAACLHHLQHRSSACFFEHSPLPAFFPHATVLSAAIADQLAETIPNYAVHHLHQRLNSQALQLPVFEAINLNTPEQWRRFINA